MQDPKDITHISPKDERDLLLEYSKINVHNLTKVNLCGIEFDNVNIDEAVAAIKYFIDKKDHFHHILLLDPVKLIYFMPGKKFSYIAEKADMILAEGAGIAWASNTMNKPLKERIPAIGLMMDIFRMAEIKNYTIFLYGSKDEIIERVYFILTRHFPKIRIVGRHAGHLKPQRELMVKESIRKTSPDIIFIAKNFLEQEKWIEENAEYLGNSVVIGVNGSFDILSGRVKKAPDYFKTKGLIWLWRIFVKPWRIVRLVNLVHFFLLVIYNSFKNKKDQKSKSVERN